MYQRYQKSPSSVCACKPVGVTIDSKSNVREPTLDVELTPVGRQL